MRFKHTWCSASNMTVWQSSKTTCCLSYFISHTIFIPISLSIHLLYSHASLYPECMYSRRYHQFWWVWAPVWLGGGAAVHPSVTSRAARVLRTNFALYWLYVHSDGLDEPWPHRNWRVSTCTLTLMVMHIHVHVCTCNTCMYMTSSMFSCMYMYVWSPPSQFPRLGIQAFPWLHI